MQNKLWYIALGSALTLVVTVTGITFANNTSGEITACVHVKTGMVRIIDGAAVNGCTTSEREVHWNQAGVPGPQGPQGETGPQGEPGVAGWDEERILALEQRVLALEGQDNGPYETTISFTLSNGNPDATTLPIQSDDKTEFSILIFEATAGQGGPVNVAELAVRLDTNGASYQNLLDDAYISIAGDIYEYSYVSEIDADTVMLVFEFEPNGLEIAPGESKEIEFFVALEEQDGNYELGQTIQASVLATDSVYWQAEGYDDLAPSAFIGDAIGAVHMLDLEQSEE